jgi:hypothetical protein
MLIIKHRLNTIKKLENLRHDYGAEIDIRSYNREIIISHDPFKKGEKLKKWLKKFKHKFIIFNIKEEGLEFQLQKLLKKFKIKEFFLLDQSFPFYIKNIKTFGKNSSIRVSEFEGIERAIKLRKFTNWLWVDHFSKFPLSKENIKILNSLKFKFCIVSPELVSEIDLLKKVSIIKNIFRSAKVKIDAVCTKKPSYWI